MPKGKIKFRSVKDLPHVGFYILKFKNIKCKNPISKRRCTPEQAKTLFKNIVLSKQI